MSEGIRQEDNELGDAAQSLNGDPGSGARRRRLAHR